MAKTTITSTTERISRAGLCPYPVAMGLVLFLCLPAAGEQVDPHWNKHACQACHLSSEPAAGNLGLTADSAEALCAGCHSSGGDGRSCRHVSGIPPGDMTIPPGYSSKLENGNLVCTTCHDLAIQCLAPSRSYSFANPGFVRERKSRERGAHCFNCHDASGFERLNPHQMQTGNPSGPTCTLCHASEPTKDEHGWVATGFSVPGSLNDLCTGCHDVQPHPGNSFSGKPIGWEHLAVPSAEIRENMQRSEQAEGLIFPLDPRTGELHCATCHNPHPGELEDYPVAVQPGSKGRLRVDKICQACHDL
jgi:hypothetical protein